MNVLPDFALVVETLVEVGFAVVVEVVQAGDLVAAEDVDLVVDNAQAEGLEETGGVALPLQRFQLVVDPGDPPDVAINRAGRDVSV